MRRRLLILNWRDTRHPEGGGSEVYVEQVALLLRDKGYLVTMFSARSAGLPRSEYRDGLHFVRRGGHLTVYLWAAVLQLLGRLGRPDVVLEVQNGMPFLARLYTRRPVVVLVHHVHREQWPVVGPLLSRLGWLMESRVAPLVNRTCDYLAVSAVTKAELVDLGVAAHRITVAYNGVPPIPPEATPRSGDLQRSSSPRLVVLSRLVPHKQIEHAITCLARLRPEFPDLTLVVMGSGWWHDELLEHVRTCDVSDQVIFKGHADDLTKHRELARAWVHLLPSLKEGWGLSIVEAATHATPTVAYYAAGGVQESIQDGVTGLLAIDLDDLVSCTRTLLADEALRTSLGTKAQTRANDFSWSSTADLVDQVLTSA